MKDICFRGAGDYQEEHFAEILCPPHPCQPNQSAELKRVVRSWHLGKRTTTEVLNQPETDRSRTCPFEATWPDPQRTLPKIQVSTLILYLVTKVQSTSSSSSLAWQADAKPCGTRRPQRCLAATRGCACPRLQGWEKQDYKKPLHPRETQPINYCTSSAHNTKRGAQHTRAQLQYLEVFQLQERESHCGSLARKLFP